MPLFSEVIAQRGALNPTRHGFRHIPHVKNGNESDEVQMFVATIRLRISRENRKELTQTLASLAATILRQEGCRSCRVYRQVDTDDVIVLIEEWKTSNDWERHFRSTEFAVLQGAMDLVKDPEAIEFMLLNPVGGWELWNSR